MYFLFCIRAAVALPFLMLASLSGTIGLLIIVGIHRTGEIGDRVHNWIKSGAGAS